MTNGYRVWLDLQATQNQSHPERGTARYVTESAAALVRRDAPIVGLGLNPSEPLPAALPDELLNDPRLTYATATEFARRVGDDPFIHHVLSPYENATSPRDMFPPWLACTGGALVATVYDLIPELFAARYLSSPGPQKRFAARRRTLESARLLLCLSASTRNDLIRLHSVDPDICHVVGAGASSYFSPADPSDTDDEAVLRHWVPALERPFVLCVSGFEWRKNTETLLEAWAELPRSFRLTRQLVIACALPAEGHMEWTLLARRLGIRPEELVMTGSVSDQVLRALYRRAHLFVFPSRYEGFGLPPLEAARCGCPVITSDSSSLPEVLACPPSTFDPEDVKDMAQAIVRASENESLRAELTAAGAAAAARHTWEAVADRTIEAYETLAPTRRTLHRRRRVALVAPLPPTRSGIANYTHRLLGALRPSIDVTCFADRDLELGAGGRPRGSAYPTQAYGSKFHDRHFHATIYVLGNSNYHLETSEKAERGGGIVWLHDAFLGGLVISRAKQLAPSAPWDAALGWLQQTYGDRVPRSVVQAPLDPGRYRGAGLLCTRSYVSRARGVIVNSHHARAMVEFDNFDINVPPIVVIPHAIPQREPNPQHDVVEHPVVASFGVQARHKRPFDVLRAVAALPRRDVEIRLVGPCEPDLEEELRLEAARLGLAERTRITGWVDHDEYERHLRESTVAVQLRTFSHGECSGAVIDAISVGTPVITAVESASELPEGVAVRVGPHESVESIAAHLDGLVGRGWQHHHAAALDYARTWTFDAAARAVTDFIDSLVGA